jgi:hypothetical protein
MLWGEVGDLLKDLYKIIIRVNFGFVSVESSDLFVVVFQAKQ